MSTPADTPFRIAVLGDFSGRGNRGQCESGHELAARKIWRIDRDRFGQVMQQLDVRLVNLMRNQFDEPTSLQFQSIDDFHPDQLIAGLELFASLRDLRNRLLDDATFHEAANEIIGWGTSQSEGQEPSLAMPDEGVTGEGEPDQRGTDESTGNAADSGDLLEQMLTSASPAQPDDESQWRKLIHDIAAPYSVPGTDPRQAELKACVDTATEAAMRTLLHHPDFQELEAAWRSVFFLIRRLETDELLQVHLIDVSKHELTEDLFAGDALKSSGLYQLLVEQSVKTPGADPWTLLVGNYSFGPTDEDAALLGRLAKISAAAGAALLTGTAKESFGEQGDKLSNANEWSIVANETWQSLRQLPESAVAGLAWPPFLLRLPYGAASEPIEDFAFEELDSPTNQQFMLWGNGAILCAAALGEAFSIHGWSMDVGRLASLDRMPLWIFEQDGVSQVFPCGQTLITDSVAENMLSQGLISARSVRDQDSILLGPLTSLRGNKLLGRWDG